jgi:hypothetical protein
MGLSLACILDKKSLTKLYAGSETSAAGLSRSAVCTLILISRGWREREREGERDREREGDAGI